MKIKSVSKGGRLYATDVASMYTVCLLMEDDNGYLLSGDTGTTDKVKQFLASEDYSTDDAADAFSRAIGFLKLINTDLTKVKFENKNSEDCYYTKGNAIFAKLFVKKYTKANGESRKIFVGFQVKGGAQNKDQNNLDIGDES